MHVTWVSHTGQIGGAELCLVEAVMGLTALGVANSVILPEDGPLAPRLAEAGASVQVARYGWWVTPGSTRRGRLRRGLRALLGARAIRRLLRELAPDLVVTNTIATPSGAFAAYASGIPHLWYVHEFGREDHGMEFDLGTRLSAWVMAHLSRRVLLTSRAVEEKYRPLMRGAALRVVHCAVMIGRVPVSARGGGERELTAVLVGALTEGKRQEDAIRAVAVLAARGRKVRLVLLGRGEPGYADTLRRLAQELGITSQVEFAGFSPTPEAVLASADAALVCSRREAWGRVSVESMKLGVPVLGADNGGTLELVRDGWNGLLYRTGDPADLAAKLETLACDPERARRMGENARGWANATFTLEGYAAELATVFAEVLRSVTGASE